VPSPSRRGEGETQAVSERRGSLDLVESGVAASDDGLLGGVGVALWTPSPAASSVWARVFFTAATMRLTPWANQRAGVPTIVPVPG